MASEVPGPASRTTRGSQVSTPSSPGPTLLPGHLFFPRTRVHFCSAVWSLSLPQTGNRGLTASPAPAGATWTHRRVPRLPEQAAFHTSEGSCKPGQRSSSGPQKTLPWGPQLLPSGHEFPQAACRKGRLGETDAGGEGV